MVRIFLRWYKNEKSIIKIIQTVGYTVSPVMYNALEVLKISTDVFIEEAHRKHFITVSHRSFTGPSRVIHIVA
jgi:hypothetical protein